MWENAPGFGVAKKAEIRIAFVLGKLDADRAGSSIMRTCFQCASALALSLALLGGCGEEAALGASVGGASGSGGTGGDAGSGGARGPGGTVGTGGTGHTGGMGGLGGSGADCEGSASADFPNGVAAGDVDQSSVVLWARASCKGTVRFEYGRDPDFVQTLDGFMDVEAKPDVPAKAHITGLLAGMQYYYRACLGDASSPIEWECGAQGSFRTPHASGRHGFRFGVSSCFESRMRPFVSIRNVPDRDLDAFVALGDTVYADHADACSEGDAKNLDDFRCKNRLAYEPWRSPEDNMLALARASTAFFVNIDDHEVVDNFAGGEPKSGGDACAPEYGENCQFFNETAFFEAGLQAFEEYNPTREERYGQTGDPRTADKRKLYRYRTFGKDAALFMLDARSFRDGPAAGQQVCDYDYLDLMSDVPVCDYIEFEFESYQTSVTMLGSAQLQELKNDLKDAETNGIIWKFILIPEPIQNLGPAAAPDRFEGYAYERAVILDFIEEQCIGNVVFISGDIHGTIANNLVYRPFFGGGAVDFLTTLRRYSSSWDISTGPGAYETPYGKQLSTVRDLFCAKPDVIDVIDGACGCDRGDYDSLTTAGKDKAIEDFMDCVLGVLNYPKTGLSFKPQIVLVPPYDIGLDSLRNSTIPEKLLRQRYVATSTFGWTEFNIHAVTQKLTVTTYGVEPYELPSVRGGYSDEEAEDFLNRVPRIMSQFEVEPRCGCQEPVCINDESCGNGCICNAIGCVLRNSFENGELCADADACASGVCNLTCVAPRSVPLGDPCVADAACLRGRCGILGDEPVGFCQAVCGDGVCDAARPEEECGKDNAGVSCLADCGRCGIGHLCAVDATCASGRCSAGRCAPCLQRGALCARDGSCCSNKCTIGGLPPTPRCN